VNSITNIIILGLLSFFFSGCSQTDSPEIPEYIQELENLTIYSTEGEPVLDMRLIRDQTFGSSAEQLIGNVDILAVDSEERVFIADLELRTIHIFDSEGRYLKRLGKGGRGPGEFVIGPVPFIGLNRLFAFDPTQRRMSVFSLDSLTFIRDFNMNFGHPHNPEKLAGFSLHQLVIINEEAFLAIFDPLNTIPPKLPGQKIEMQRRYYLVNGDGKNMADKLLEQKGNIWLTARIDGRVQMAKNFPFLGKPLLTVSPEGHLFTAWSEDFLIKVYDTQGTYKNAFYYPYQKVPLTWESINMHLSNFSSAYAADFRRQVIRQNTLPKSWPAMNEILVDDENRLWISTIIDDQEVYQWWVLDAEDGSLLTQFTWPRKKSIEEIKNDKLYTRETDEETGLQQIVRYSIEMN